MILHYINLSGTDFEDVTDKAYNLGMIVNTIIPDTGDHSDLRIPIAVGTMSAMLMAALML